MSNDPNKRPVRIFNAKTGESRLSEPVAVHPPRQSAEADPSATTPSSEPVTSGDASTSVPSVSSASAPPQDGEVNAQAASASQAGPEVIANSAATESVSTAAAHKSAGAAKPKVDIETLEQFIEYAYGRKGQRVSLKAKVEKAIAQNPRLDDGALSRLLSLAAGDVVLAVPRQLLLLSRDIDGHPALRSALVSFVSTVMLRHPVFAEAGVQGALRNLPEALAAADALAKVAAFNPADDGGKDTLKGAELQALRRNAAHLFATWLANNRSMNAEELAALLLQVLWSPAARDLADDNARLRALTEIEQPAGVGLACQRFRQQAIEARSSQDQALGEVNKLRVRLADIDTQRLLAEHQRDALAAELQALRERTAAEAAELQRQHEVERTHLRHGQEQLRGRLQRRLDEGVEMLEVGLTALRNKTPRVEVMMERAEHVVDALRAEMNNLREE